MKTVYQEHKVPEEYLEKWQKTVDLMAKLFEVPAGLIMRVDPRQIEVLVSSHSEGNPYKRGEKADLGTGLYCETVMANRSQLQVPNALQDEDWKDNPDIKRDMISYLGIPLIWPGGKIFGTICVLDDKIRNFSELYQSLLWEFKGIIESDFRIIQQSKELKQEIAHRKQAEKELRESEQLNRTMTENSPIGISVRDKNGTLILSNRAWQKLWGLSNNEISDYHKPRKKLVFNDKDSYLSDHIDKINNVYKTGGEYYVQELKLPHTKKNGAEWIEQYFYAIKDDKGNVQRVVILTEDITQQKQAEDVQKTLYNISNALNTTDKMSDLYSKIREYLGNVIDTKNFYIALYDEKTDMISLPFDVDEKDKFKTFPAGKTITKYVIKTGKPILASKQLQDKLAKQGKIEIIGARSEIWLGVPLKIENKVIGVIAVQSYDDPNLYTEKDIEILTFISEEIALAIKHKQAEEELKISRERLKVANSILRHDIANDVIVIKSALDIFRNEQDETMLDEIEKRVVKSLNTINIQRDQEQFIDSHAALDEYDIEKVSHDIIKNYPDIKINVTGTGRAYADNAIYSVFENIISNAIKHGKTTKLDIDISYNEDYCEIKFTDYGIGIPDEFKYKIFGEGFQYGKTGHTGIGLYIVKQTVDDYGGEVFVEDNKPNGAVFIIRLKKIIEM